MSNFNTYKLNFRQNNGFTLIEVLIAGFILFLVISTTTLIYRGAVLSSHKAERSIYINGMLPLMIDNIDNEIKNIGQDEILSLNGQDAVGMASYSWTAEVIDYQAPPQRSIAETGISEVPGKRFKLWQVIVNATYNDYEREYRYLQFSWNINP